MNKPFASVLLGSFAAFLLGCGQPSQPAAVTPTGASGGAPAGVVAVPSSAPVPTIQEKAGVGSGKKGRTLDQHEGIIVTPAKTYFVLKEKIAFEILIPDALRTYDALEGHFPKSHDEFMEKIIREFQIKLPELPEGHKYVYDPEKRELMVEKPAQ